MENFTDKSILRKYAKTLRENLPVKKISLEITEKLKSMEIYKEAKNILIYSSFSFEIDTKNILSDKKKKFYLPRINGEELDICLYEGENNFTENKYGIKEPKGNKIKDYGIIDTVIVPALCADRRGYRLGYGKGYYDRLLPKLKGAKNKIILIPEELFFEHLPNDDYDIRCNVIITQRNIMFI